MSTRRVLFAFLAVTAVLWLSAPAETQTDSTTHRVARVVDGDTVKLANGEKVRLIGINTPESTTTQECFGEAASRRMTELVEGKQVTLEKDVSQRDKSGRLLRYMWMGDILINELIVREGFAQASISNPKRKYTNRFYKAQI